MTETTAATVAAVRSRVEDLAPTLLAISHEIHDNPELGFAEVRAAGLLAAFLRDSGFVVTPGIADLPTALAAEFRLGDGGPTVAIFCEYDALPALGHGCGHNIIATAGAGAAVAATRHLAAVGLASGRVLVLGSPAEEGGGGKAKLLDAGCLEGVDAAVMVHPGDFDAVGRVNPGRLSLEATFEGRAAHAAAAPELGLNALDATTLTLVALGLLRQQLRDDARIHAIVTEGGDAVNIIPERTRLHVYARSPDSAYLRGRLMEAIAACVQGAAIATGTTGELRETEVGYDAMLVNPALAELASEIFDAMGRTAHRVEDGPSGSTDMGNVSQVVPALHPYLCIRPGLTFHTHEFAAAAASPEGDAAVLDGAVLLGATVSRLLADPDQLAAARTTFAASKS